MEVTSACRPAILAVASSISVLRPDIAASCSTSFSFNAAISESWLSSFRFISATSFVKLIMFCLFSSMLIFCVTCSASSCVKCVSCLALSCLISMISRSWDFSCAIISSSTVCKSSGTRDSLSFSASVRALVSGLDSYHSFTISFVIITFATFVSLLRTDVPFNCTSSTRISNPSSLSLSASVKLLSVET